MHEPGSDPFLAQRLALVRELESAGIRDPDVLAAFALVPRERFVPPDLVQHAYDDSALGIGRGQTISQPYMVARMTELLELTRPSRSWPWPSRPGPEPGAGTGPSGASGPGDASGRGAGSGPSRSGPGAGSGPGVGSGPSGAGPSGASGPGAGSRPSDRANQAAWSIDRADQGDGSVPLAVADQAADLRLGEAPAPAGPAHHPRALDVGTGSGYQAAILAALGAEVISIERDHGLSESAEARIRQVGLGLPVRCVLGDGSEGWPDGAPYDGIVVAAAAPQVPEPLLAQLADGGRLVVPIGPRDHQWLHVFTKRGEHIEERVSEPCVFVPLVGRFGFEP